MYYIYGSKWRGGIKDDAKNCIDAIGIGLTVIKKFMTIMNVWVNIESELGGKLLFAGI